MKLKKAKFSAQVNDLLYISLFLNNAKAYHIFAKQLPLIYGLFTAIQFRTH